MPQDMQTSEGHFFFDPADPIYRDHFPGRPVVPGSLIVQAFMTVIDRLRCADALETVERFRFKRFIAPGTYVYRLEERQCDSGGHGWHCSLFDGDQLVASGDLM